MNESRSTPTVALGWDAEPEEELLQRRWFAALTATRRLEIECRQLLEVLRRADEAWRRAASKLAEFESLTEALENEVTGRDDVPRRLPASQRLAQVSAA